MEISSLMNAIDALNLESIKFRLMDKEDGLGWSLEKADEVEREYKKFLFLSSAYKDTPLCPSKEIDKFWHYHILDTQKYHEDCMNAFGCFIHHIPYLGLRGDADKELQIQTHKKMYELYSKHFGAQYHLDGDSAASCNCRPNARLRSDFDIT